MVSGGGLIWMVQLYSAETPREIAAFAGGLSVVLTVIQCDQTTACGALRIMSREEVGQSLQGRVRFLLRVRLQHVNNSDCSSGAFSARRRRLGIYAVASLKWLPNKHGHVLFNPICGMREGRSAPRIKPASNRSRHDWRLNSIERHTADKLWQSLFLLVQRRAA